MTEPSLITKTPLLVALLAVVALTACANQDDMKKRLRESDGYYKEGVSFVQSDQQRAFVSFQKAIQHNPDNFDAHYALGSIYFQRKELPEAEREFRLCTELDPHSGEALNFLGRTLLLQARNREAIEVLRKAATQPLYATPDIAYADLGSLLEHEGDLSGAIHAYESVLKTDPPNVPRPFVYLLLGRLYLKQGNNQKARGALLQAKSMDPDGTVGTEAGRLMQRLK